MSQPECPTNIERRIDDALDRHNRECRREGRPKDMLPYDRSVSSLATAAGSKHVYLNWNSPDACVLIQWNDADDWRRFRYKFVTSDEAIRRFMEPIVLEYIEEMFQYYQDYGCEPKKASAIST